MHMFFFWSGVEVEQSCTIKYAKSCTTNLQMCNKNMQTSIFSTLAKTKTACFKET